MLKEDKADDDDDDDDEEAGGFLLLITEVSIAFSSKQNMVSKQERSYACLEDDEGLCSTTTGSWSFTISLRSRRGTIVRSLALSLIGERVGLSLVDGGGE